LSSFSIASPSARALLDSYLRLRALTPREELSLALYTIELERIWVRVEFDSLHLVIAFVRAVRPAAMAIQEISTPRAVAQVASLTAHISSSQPTLATARLSPNDPSIRVEDVVKQDSGCVCLYAVGVIVQGSYERLLEVKQERRVGIEGGRRPDTCGEDV
jgi:hypothetical protein